MPVATHVFTFSVRRRSKPSTNYTGILRTHRFYIEYYDVLAEQEPEKVVSENEPRIAFPVRFTEAVLSFAEELGGRVVNIRRVRPPRSKYTYEKPLVILPNEVAFRRHLLFSLTISTYRKPSKINSVRILVSTLNANLLNILTQIALDRYSELRGSGSASWHWYMLRVGRAVKVLYKLE